MNEYYTDLYLSVINEEMHRQTCNYWYLVTCRATSHTAFETKRGLMRWLNERNLKLTAPLTEPGVPSNQKIEGGYFRKTWLGEQPFAMLADLTPDTDHTKVLDNGQYTLGIRTEDENGIISINLLNPNCQRVVFPHAEAALEMR